jgi:hypothetical protein
MKARLQRAVDIVRPDIQLEYRLPTTSCRHLIPAVFFFHHVPVLPRDFRGLANVPPLLELPSYLCGCEKSGRGIR